MGVFSFDVDFGGLLCVGTLQGGVGELCIIRSVVWMCVVHGYGSSCALEVEHWFESCCAI